MPLNVNPAHHALHPLGVVIYLGHVFAQDPTGHVLRQGRAAATQQFHQHQRLVVGLRRIRMAMECRRRA